MYFQSVQQSILTLLYDFRNDFQFQSIAICGLQILSLDLALTQTHSCSSRLAYFKFMIEFASNVESTLPTFFMLFQFFLISNFSSSLFFIGQYLPIKMHFLWFFSRFRAISHSSSCISVISPQLLVV